MEPEISTAFGRVRGRTAAGTRVFRGIPYARPPVGELRFAAPEPPERWDGVRDAAAFGPAAPQSGWDGPPPPDPASSDWLTLNIWTPDEPNDGLPVFVWIHGGAYRGGSSGLPSYDGAMLAARGMVVVTLNYRLGVEGWAQIDGAPANRGLLDAVAALRWVAENIAAFGGDPDNVTAAGESAGAGVVASLLAMPSARGLFRKAVVSSLPGSFFSAELAADIARQIAIEAGVGEASRKVLADLPPARLSAAGDAVAARLREHPNWGELAFGDTPYSPVVDGDVLPRTPWRALLDGDARDIRLLTGHNRDEYRRMVAGMPTPPTEEDTAALLEAFAPSPAKYRFAYAGLTPSDLYERLSSDWLFRMPTLHLAQAHAVGGGTVYLYELTYQSPAAAEFGACHALDLPLLFGTPFPDLTGDSPGASFRALGELMRTEWVEFASTGSPGWAPYTAAHRTTRIYDDPARTASYPEDTSMHLWERHTFGALPLRQPR
jgi:para-nitrobenzyl esterase